MLIDIKTVKEKSPRAQYFYQLLGYFILARHAHRLKPSFPTINILGLYFSRHGYLRTWDVKPLHKDPEFLILEQWFLDEAAGHHADGTACDMCPTPGEGKNCAHCIAMNLPQVPTLETNPILSRPRLTHQITPFTPDRTLARPRDGIAALFPAPSTRRETRRIY
jgi:hypothetical protein